MIKIFENNFYKNYPIAGKYVSELEVTDNIPNIDSISSTFYDYEIIKKIREIPLDDFEAKTIYDLYYAKNDIDQSEELAKKIEMNKYIDPLIVVQDKKGIYVLEGGHRLGALMILNKKTLPALVVIDKEDE